MLILHCQTLSGTKQSTCVSFLRPLSDSATLACSVTYAAFYKVVPSMHCMQTLLHEKALYKWEVNTIMIARNLIKWLKTRFPHYKMTPLCILAAFRDPVLKDARLETRSEKYHEKFSYAQKLQKNHRKLLMPQTKLSCRQVRSLEASQLCRKCLRQLEASASFA